MFRIRAGHGRPNVHTPMYYSIEGKDLSIHNFLFFEENVTHIAM